ncbi:MAG: energy-coupling factor ABC transporter ATP-binding protein [Desulfobacterales bacterium]|nr:MAG: energy-coupling factor ABC transporter ATP-binding protein [Desulfobacterales bacterium]
MTSSFILTNRLQYAYAKSKEHRALDNINLEIKPDEFLLVCGASGSGKSTLCRTFNGLIPHFYEGKLQGQVFVAGESTTGQSVAGLSAQVGMVFQNAEAQLFNRTVELEIAFSLESLGIPRAQIKKRIAETVEMMGIEEFLPRNPHELSTGEQQLVSIVAILATNPQIIVLDEPYANLDHVNVRRVRAALNMIHKRQKGIVICEHRLPQTVNDVQRMVGLQRGHIVLNGTPDKVLQRDIEQFDLETPLSARIGRQLRLPNLPLDVPTLKKDAPAISYPTDLKPNLLQSVPSGSSLILEVENVSFKLDNTKILRDISFALRVGECLAVVGANGAGKTTLLKHLNGLLRPSNGQIRVMGQDTSKSKVSDLARYVGIAFQNPDNQFFKLTVWDEIRIGAKVLGRYDESWLQELVELFGLKPLLNRSPYQLSGGEKKRVAFAGALACKPKILALDEPTAGQDLNFRRVLGEVLAHLRKMGQAVFLVTHDLSFAEQQAHRWLLLSKGQIIADGSPWEVMADANTMTQANLEPTDAFLLYGGENRGQVTEDR